jgi:hypothetical protein
LTDHTIPVELTTLTFPELRLRASDAGRLRGYFAKIFGDDSVLFHNHTEADGFRYAYTLIQYKVLRGLPTVIGVADGARLVMQAFMDVEELDLGGQIVRVDDKELKVDKVRAGVIDELREYRLATPIWAFNQANYGKFKGMPEEEVPGFLKRLFTSHLVTALRGIGCEVSQDKPIMISLRLQPRLVNAKNQRMQMYVGGFTANVALPEGIGIGKSVSKGFGTVVPV